MLTETQAILESIPETIKKTFPIPGRFRGSLPSQIAELSRLLTNGRGDRSLSYLGRPNFLFAYLYYFLPWNLCRLCLLLPDLDINLCAGDKVIDLGSGPLTLVCALWISRPDLRNLPLEFICIDRCAPVLEAGKKFFAVIGGENKWKINLVKDDVDIRKTDVTRKQKPAALVCAVNMFNKIYENLPHGAYGREGLQRMAASSARLMHKYASPSASILTVEPGVPQSGHFIAFLRNAFLELNRPPKSPCTHIKDCPLSGAKKRWCHFAYEASDFHFAKDLQRLSAAAGIPKERLVFSYLLTGAVTNRDSYQANQRVRVISDAFPLPYGNVRAVKRFGRYGCSQQGLILLTGEKSRIEKTVYGSIVAPNTENKSLPVEEQRDAKSGAIIMEIT